MHTDSKIPILHLINSFALGGAERVAINLVNELRDSPYDVHLVTTRGGGPLASALEPHVKCFGLHRQRWWHIQEVWRLARYIRQNDIRLIHAHTRTVLDAAWASFFGPRPSIVWHIHDPYRVANSTVSLGYRFAAHFVKHVITVNEAQTEWVRNKLKIDAVKYIPNAVYASAIPDVILDLPGTADRRILCVARFNPQKDQITLVRAMLHVLKAVPDAHLLLVGSLEYEEYASQVRAEIARLKLGDHITLLGRREDIAAINAQCAIGVLSSENEGFPVTLLEYGLARLPVVATEVGQCPDILDYGESGVLVPPKSPERLAEALIALLNDPTWRAALGDRLCERVNRRYSAPAVMQQIREVYETILAAN